MHTALTHIYYIITFFFFNKKYYILTFFFIVYYALIYTHFAEMELKFDGHVVVFLSFSGVM